MLIPSGVFAQGIPEPPPATSCNDYEVLLPSSWAKDAQGYLINSVGIKTNASVIPSQQYGTLSVSYRYVKPNAPIALFARGDTYKYRDVSIYEVTEMTNISVCTVGTYTGKYYALVTNNKVFDLVYLPENCSETQGLYEFTDENANPVHHCLNQTTERKLNWDLEHNPNNQSRWFTLYLKKILTDTRGGKSIGTVPGGIDDCGSQFKSLVSEIADLRRKTYYFATNGCEEATLEQPCETDINKRDHVLFRPKSTGESIPDTMIAYQQALKEIIQLDPGNVLAALAKTYEIESLIFTDEGIQRMKEIGDLSISITNRVKTLEDKCNTYINDPARYCVEIPKYDPNPDLKEKICNWKDLKAIADKAIKLGQLVGQNPTTTVAGPLNDWENSVLRKVICWIRNAIISVYYFLANFAAFFLQRNY